MFEEAFDFTGLGARPDEEDKAAAAAEAPELSSSVLKKAFTVDPLLSAKAFASSLCNSNTVFNCNVESFDGVDAFFVGFLVAFTSPLL
jgi:hypothetical protein